MGQQSDKSSLDFFYVYTDHVVTSLVVWWYLWLHRQQERFLVILGMCMVQWVWNLMSIPLFSRKKWQKKFLNFIHFLKLAFITIFFCETYAPKIIKIQNKWKIDWWTCVESEVYDEFCSLTYIQSFITLLLFILFHFVNCIH
jgi:hypothetical protein